MRKKSFHMSNVLLGAFNICFRVRMIQIFDEDVLLAHEPDPSSVGDGYAPASAIATNAFSAPQW